MRLNSLISLIKEYFIFASIGIGILSIALYFGYSIIYKKKMKGRKSLASKQVIFGIIILVYLLMVLSVTFLSRGSHYPSSVDLNLFSSYRQAWNTFTLLNWQFVILNIIMFVPLGILLPLFHKRFLSPIWTIGTGLALTLLIEAFQLITKLGIFELDDIFNNLLGTILGYCLFMCIYLIIKKETRRLVKYILPILIVVGVFFGIFIKYEKQEYGNLYFNYTYKFNLKNTDIKSKVEFSEEDIIAPVYYTKSYTPKELEEFAIMFFEDIGVSSENMDGKLMNEDILFRNKGYHLWLKGNSGAYNYTDFTSFDDGIEKKNLSQDEVAEKLDKFNIELPKEVDFSNDGVGEYYWKANNIIVDNKMIGGYISCMTYNDNTIKEIRNYMIVWEEYKEENIISEKEAYEILSEGKFNIWIEDNKIESIEIEDVYLDYEADTKNFFQPIYVFKSIISGKDYNIRIPAIK